MESINKRYLVDEQNKKVAVQIPIDAFEKKAGKHLNPGRHLSLISSGCCIRD